MKLKSDAGEVHILKDINLNLEQGRTVSITGPSGSGKTSLLMVLSGLERPTGGKITVAGQDLSAMGEDGLAAFRRDQIGIVFQNFHLIPTMTALENVAVPLELRGEKDAFEKAKAALEQVGLGHRLTHYPGQLSGGEQQRTALARAFATKPRLILADEPTGNLDAATGEKVLEVLFGLAEQGGTTLLIVTHDPKLAARCQQAVKIADGRIAA
ncbi:MAG: ABC transporter ATP-binding protein [Alphaproteobacteria bacterium]